MDELIKKWEDNLRLKQSKKKCTTYKQQRAFISGQIGIIKEAIKDLKELQKDLIYKSISFDYNEKPSEQVTYAFPKDTAHPDGDFSYLCGNEYCKCAQ